MRINHDPIIKYACPVCGHFFYESQWWWHGKYRRTPYTSNNRFEHNEFIQCACCNSIYEKHFLDIIVLSDDELDKITSFEYRNKYIERNGCNYGSVDADCFKLPLSVNMFSEQFWRGADKQLYFPEFVNDYEKQIITNIFYVWIWRIAHFRRLLQIRESALTIEKLEQHRKHITSAVYHYKLKENIFMIIAKKTLGQKLREMYDNAPYNERVLMIHLFGIKFADIIRANGYNAREIIEEAGMKESYQTELSKGMKMAKYVEIKKNMDAFDFD